MKRIIAVTALAVSLAAGSFAGGWRLAVVTDTGTVFPYNAATNPAVRTLARLMRRGAGSATKSTRFE